jgi:excisionase family DNA binding protein
LQGDLFSFGPAARQNPQGVIFVNGDEELPDRLLVSYVLEFASHLLYPFRLMAQQTLVRPTQVARLLAVSRSTVYRWFWEGRLKGIKMGTTLRILESSVKEMLDAAF